MRACECLCEPHKFPQDYVCACMHVHATLLNHKKKKLTMLQCKHARHVRACVSGCVSHASCHAFVCACMYMHATLFKKITEKNLLCRNINTLALCACMCESLRKPRELPRGIKHIPSGVIQVIVENRIKRHDAIAWRD